MGQQKLLYTSNFSCHIFASLLCTWLPSCVVGGAGTSQIPVIYQWQSAGCVVRLSGCECL